MLWRWSIPLVCLAAGAAWAAWTYIPRKSEEAPVQLPTPQPEQVAAEPEELPMPRPDFARKEGLEGVHLAAAELFAQTPGFGLERMPVFWRKVDRNVVFWSPGELETESPYGQTPELTKAAKSFAEFFARVKGPASHFDFGLRGYLQLPEMTSETSSADTTQAASPKMAFKKSAKSWRIEIIDLVGLLEPDNPVVYDTHKVLMSHLKFGPDGKPVQPPAKKFEQGPNGKLLPANARVPDFFELAGIERIKAGANLFVRHKDNVIRMLGPLHATTQCLKCHEDYKEGDVLGALSYTIRRTN